VQIKKKKSTYNKYNHLIFIFSIELETPPNILHSDKQRRALHE